MVNQSSPPPDPRVKQLGREKLARIPVQVEQAPTLKKPDWLRVKLTHTDRVQQLKDRLRQMSLVTVCEEASCPNINECFGKGTATFMIMGDKCTRRCTFCDVGHGRPDPLNPDEPENLAQTIAALALNYVVITSVDRDDLRDGGAGHFAQCIQHTRAALADITIEILVPDFRGRMDKALAILSETPPDVFNHNIETAASLYRAVRPGSDYQWSLKLLQQFKQRQPSIPTKSGLMVGLGESDDEVQQVLRDLRAHQVNMVTIGQYLQPTPYHAPVKRYVSPAQFDEYADYARSLGFDCVASGPLVRSSYHADKQAAGESIR